MTLWKVNGQGGPKKKNKMSHGVKTPKKWENTGAQKNPKCHKGQNRTCSNPPKKRERERERKKKG